MKPYNGKYYSLHETYEDHGRIVIFSKTHNIYGCPILHDPPKRVYNYFSKERLKTND